LEQLQQMDTHVLAGTAVVGLVTVVALGKCLAGGGGGDTASTTSASKKKKKSKAKGTESNSGNGKQVTQGGNAKPAAQANANAQKETTNSGGGKKGKKSKSESKSNKAAAPAAAAPAAQKVEKPVKPQREETVEEQVLREHREAAEHAAYMKAMHAKNEESKNKNKKKKGGGSSSNGLSEKDIADGWEAAPTVKTPGQKKAAKAAAPVAAPVDPNADVKDFIEVEAKKIGIIIGPGGGTIKAVMEKTGARIQMPDRERDSIAPAQVAITGPAPAVKAAKAAIKELATKGYCTALQEQGFEESHCMVPPGQLHEVIGKGGAIIRKIQESLEVKMNVPRTQDQGLQISSYGAQRPKPCKVGIAGKKENCQKAKEVIKAILKYHHHDLTHPGATHVEVDIPYTYYSYIIGVRGAEMRHIQANFGVAVHIPNQDSQCESVLVVGPAANCAKAKDYMAKLIVKADESRSRGYDDEDDDYDDEDY